MRPTGRRSRTDRSRPAILRSLPRLNRGRERTFSLSIALLIATCLVPPPAWGQELLSWWKRDLLPLELEPGSWVVYASEELSEGQTYVDTLRVEVLAADSLGRRWIELEDAGSRERDLLLVDPTLLSPDRSLLDALVRHLRWLPGDELIEEDVEEHRRSRLVARHFQDPFRDPEIDRTAMADTSIQGRTWGREKVVLREVREEPRPVGGGALVTRLRSEAELSAAVPVFGVLRGRSVTEVLTRSGDGEEDPRRRRMPPLRSEFRWICLEFGRGEAAGLPDALLP